MAADGTSSDAERWLFFLFTPNPDDPNVFGLEQ
jgi:hypothetical protein